MYFSKFSYFWLNLKNQEKPHIIVLMGPGENGNNNFFQFWENYYPNPLQKKVNGVFLFFPISGLRFWKNPPGGGAGFCNKFGNLWGGTVSVPHFSVIISLPSFSGWGFIEGVSPPRGGNRAGVGGNKKNKPQKLCNG